MSKPDRSLKWVFLLALVTAPALLWGRPGDQLWASPSLTLDSYQRARKALDAAIEVMGGMERIDSIETLAIKAQGETILRNQSPAVEPPFATTPLWDHWAFDLEEGWVFDDRTYSNAGGIVISSSVWVRGEEKIETNHVVKKFRKNERLALEDFEYLERVFPALMLGHAQRRARSLRFLGEVDLEGKKHEVISFAWSNGRVFTLFLDAASHLLTRYDGISTDNIYGDTATETTFLPPYQPLDGWLVPAGFQTASAGEPGQRLRFVEVKVNQPLDESLFQVPAGYQEVPYEEPPKPKLTELAPGVHLVDGLANVLFVEFADHVLMVDAPQSSGMTAQAVRMIHQKIPDKPIRYAVLTHHHDTHSGGVRTVIAESATVVTTRRAQPLLERMAAAVRTVDPDALSLDPKAARFELVDKKRTFTDGKRVVEILDLGPNPHADEILAAYLPQEKILFQADLFSIPRVGGLEPASDAAVALAKRLQELGLAIDKLVGAHGVVGTMADLEESLRLRESLGPPSGPASHTGASHTAPAPAAVQTGAPAAAAEPPNPPVARVAPTERIFESRRWTDDYAWLMDRDNPAVLAHLEAENRYTDAVMAPLAGLEKQLYDEFLGHSDEADPVMPFQQDDYFYYTRAEPDKPYRAYYRKKGSMEAPEEVVLDSNAMAEGHDYFRLGRVRTSPDHRFVAYTLDTEGDERFTLLVKDLQTGEVAPDQMKDTFRDFQWANDNRTLFYARRDAANRPYKVFRHRMGSDPEADPLVYHEPDEAFHLSVEKTKSQQYLVIRADSATTSEARLLDANRPEAPLLVFAPRRLGLDYFVQHQRDRFLILTNDGAPNFRLMETPVASPSRPSWREVLPERPGIRIESFEVFQDYVVLFEQSRGLPRIRIVERTTGKEHEVAFPEPSYTIWPQDNTQYGSPALRFRYTSLTTPMSIFEYRMDLGKLELLKQTPVRGYDPSRYVTERISTRAPDGTEVPITVAYRRGLVKDGDNPCLLIGYGAYGRKLEAMFSPDLLSLLDRGFVYAMAHARGGGEMGQVWHDQGRLLNKKNTFTDFIAVAEELIRQGYTSPKRLAIEGSSASGLLVGSVLNMRPDLFRAAVANVALVDLVNSMTDSSLPLTVIEYEEWGNPSEAATFDYMRSYSPYENVHPSGYPQVLVLTSYNDQRVPYWGPVKWAARLRAANTADTKVLVRIEMEAGHSGASGRYARHRAVAFRYAFLLDALGAAAVQPS